MERGPSLSEFVLFEKSPAAETRAPADPKRKAFVKSFGCQMNVYDSQRMADLAAREGYDETDAIEDAELIVLNTCHIRERASEKIYSELGKLRELKDERARAGRETTLVVAGCVAQAEGAEILRRQPRGRSRRRPAKLSPSARSLARGRAGGRASSKPISRSTTSSTICPRAAPHAIRGRGVAAFVTVQEGCDKFCSFCVVPYTRGAEVSRPASAVIAEIAHLAARGRQRSHADRPERQRLSRPRRGTARRCDLAALIARRGRCSRASLRVRYATSHPNDMSDA